MYSRGDVVLVLFPDSNLKTSKARPSLVVQANDLNTGLNQLIIAMITTNMQRAGHPSRVTILADSPMGEQARLKLDSVVMTDNVVTVHIEEIHRKIGTLPMTDIDRALKHTLGLT